MERARQGMMWGMGVALAMALSACNGADKLQTGMATQESNLGEIAQAARPLAALEVITVVGTDKTIIDHVASMANGEDCSTIREHKGGNYCEPYYENKPIATPLYCYRTLAKTTCYEQPSNNPGDRLIGVRNGGRLQTW